MDDYSLKNEGIYSKYSGGYVQTKNQEVGDEFSNGSLDFDGYLKLLVSQMSNQDFNDPMSDADLLNQMAQYSMLEGIKDMTQQNAISYAASLVGKVVTVSDGQYYHTGIVNSITVEKGKPSVMVDGEAFKSSEITDVVTMEDYTSLSELVGKTVKIKGAGEDANTGVVSGFVFTGGQGYVSVNGKPYAISKVEVVEPDEGEEGDETEGTEGVEGSENEGGENAAENGTVNDVDDTSEMPEENGTESQNLFKVDAVDESKAASYAASAEALADLLMKELDKVDEAKAVSTVSEQSEENFNLEEIMQTAHINVPEFAAGVYSETESLISSVDGVTAYANGDSTVSGVGNVSIRDYDRSTGTGTLVDENYSEVITENTPVTTGTPYTSNTSQSSARSYTASGKLRGVTSPMGVSSSDCVPHRVSVEQYPEEAALADELGTRMYDIRYIHNHEVTSRIKSGPVIARTQSGRGVTEIGYSGVGQLGEVVTLEDGTQRVEILLKSGKSTWLYTSGKYTLDQICTRNGARGSLSNMTGAEKAIRYYSDPNDRKSGSTIMAQIRNS